MRFLYSLAIQIFGYLVSIASLFNPKARLFYEGRKDIFQKLELSFHPSDKVIWFHCASLGEFEQGRPVIEDAKKRFKNHKILLTFFSPSGYEKRKNYEYADFVFYLPVDTRNNASRFVSIVRPRLVFFIKYEFWYNYIDQLYLNKIPIIFVSTIFRSNQYFFKPYGKWPRKQLRKVTHFFVQDEISLKLLESKKIYHADVSGDTRFDRVLKLKEEEVLFEGIEKFAADSPLLVAGSTWPADETVLNSLMKESKINFKLIIAPHEVNPERISQITKRLRQFHPILFSELDNNVEPASRVLIVDSIGQLSYLYRFAKLAYIGGGFGTGLHNILEAATYGIPVLHGPQHQRFREAVQLKKLGGSFVVKDSEECKMVFEQLLTDPHKYKKASTTAGAYVIEQGGATQKVIEKAQFFLSVN